MPSPETCYPGVSPAAPADGHIGVVASAGDTWAQLMARTAGTTKSPSTTVMQLDLKSDGNVDEFDSAYKIILGFDLSAIPVGATITAAEIQAWPTSITNNYIPPGALALTETSTTSPTALDLNDWDNHGTTRLASDKALSALSVGSLQTLFTLNAAGLAVVEAGIGGNIFLCVLLAYMLDGPPAWTAINTLAQILLASRENADPLKHPRLIVTYTESGGLIPLIAEISVGVGVGIGR